MTWKFDKAVASTFTSHARGHIPNYDVVINQSLEVCSLYGKDAAIIDVGAATGETLIQLHQAGFTNLYGVDSSADMLQACPPGIATLIHSESFPSDRQFDVVLMNWTLHFIPEKQAYLEAVYAGLKPGGSLVLTDKVSNDEVPKRFYTDMKRRHGVSEQEIINKEQSLKGIMHIDGIDWYWQNLQRLGFEQCYIINAYWCFATFLGLKKR